MPGRPLESVCGSRARRHARGGDAELHGDSRAVTVRRSRPRQQRRRAATRRGAAGFRQASLARRTRETAAAGRLHGDLADRLGGRRTCDVGGRRIWSETEPTGASATAGTTTTGASRLEMLSRWLLLAGLILLFGAAIAGVARFGGSTGADLQLGAGGWLVALAGLALFSEAQLRNADASAGELVHTSVGRALIWRALALAAAAVALLVARRGRRRARRVSLAAAALAALAAIVLHVTAGHAATGSWPHALSIALQSAHVAAVGVWIGGLAALLYGIRGAPSEAKTAAVRRFSTVAGGGFVVVAATGLARALEELSSAGDLFSTGLRTSGARQDRPDRRACRSRRTQPLAERARGRHEPRPAAPHVERRARRRGGRHRRSRRAREPRAAARRRASSRPSD